MWQRFSCGWLLSVLLCCGCGGDPNMATVSGEIKVNGQPVERGSIIFMPVNGNTAVTGTEVTAGKYRSQVPVGESKVEIRVPKKIGSRKLYDTPESPIVDEYAESLPVKYHLETELRYTATRGSHVKDWDLATSP